jgi:hypothetical protein
VSAGTIAAADAAAAAAAAGVDKSPALYSWRTLLMLTVCYLYPPSVCWKQPIEPSWLSVSFIDQSTVYTHIALQSSDEIQSHFYDRVAF